MGSFCRIWCILLTRVDRGPLPFRVYSSCPVRCLRYLRRHSSPMRRVLSPCCANDVDPDHVTQPMLRGAPSACLQSLSSQTPLCSSSTGRHSPVIGDGLAGPLASFQGCDEDWLQQGQRAGVWGAGLAWWNPLVGRLPSAPSRCPACEVQGDGPERHLGDGSVLRAHPAG